MEGRKEPKWPADYAVVDESAPGSPIRRPKTARTSVRYCKLSSIGIRCSKWLSVGSLIQPSMGMALSVQITQVKLDSS